MVVIAMSCLQETPARWVAIHSPSPSVRRSTAGPAYAAGEFFSGATSAGSWSTSPKLSRLGIYERYAKDILRDRFYVALERHNWLVWINLLQMPLFFALGFATAWLSGQPAGDAAQTGLSILLFGVFVRTVLFGILPGRSIR